MHSQDIDLYMSQRYPVVLTPLTEEEGGGWLASIRELPGCVADGETPQEAIESIEESKRLWISTALENGRSVPLPEADEPDEYSGRLTLRMPKTLHRKVAELARSEGVSQNQFLLSAIAFRTGLFESDAKKPQVIKIDMDLGDEGKQQDFTHFIECYWPRQVSMAQAYRGEVRTIVREAITSDYWPDPAGVTEREDYPGRSRRW